MRLAAPWVALLLAGCAASSAEPLDTGDIAPEGSAALVFDEPGMVAIHCHPHPFMEQKVRVMEGAGEAIHVHIFDGNSTGEFRFDPPTLEVAVGSNVTYHNHGTQVHTATQDMHSAH